VTVVDTPAPAATEATLRRYDGRAGYRVIRNAANAGYSVAANQGIRAARGEYVLLLNPDTRVTAGFDERLLAHFSSPDVGAVGPVSNYVSAAQRVERHLGGDPLPPRIDLAELGELVSRRNAGRAVPADLLIGFCLMVPRRVFDEVGLFDEALVLGNDDLDFSWRLKLAGKRLLVATDVFVYHRGQVSFATRPREETDAAVQASTDALQRKLEAHYGQGRAPSGRELWGIDWFRPTGLAATTPALPASPPPRTSIVIPVLEQLSYTKLALEGIEKHTPAGEYEIVVVDNGSRDGTPSFLAGRRDVVTITNASNRGFPAACNQGIAAARGAEIVLLNNDVVVTAGWLAGLRRCAGAPGVGIVGPMTNVVKGPQKDETARYDDLDAMHRHAADVARRRRGLHVEVERLMGFCLFVRREVFDVIGGLDERFGIGNYEDDDFSLRARKAGFRLRIAGDVFVHHYGSRTFAARAEGYDDVLERNRRLFDEKWRAEGIRAEERKGGAFGRLPSETE
jgi:GT2 family glycosyltransferase